MERAQIGNQQPFAAATPQLTLALTSSADLWQRFEKSLAAHSYTTVDPSQP